MDTNFFSEYKEFALLFLGVFLGGIASWIVNKITEKKKGLIVQTTGRRIIVESASFCPFKITDLEGRPLDNVYLINIRVWNKGNQHVLGSEISKDCPLIISLDKETKTLGDPIIFRGSDKIGLSLQLIDVNTYKLDFECINPDEWSEIGIFVEGKSDSKVSASGRVFGQNHDFNVTIDDGTISFGERLLVGFTLLFIVLWPFGAGYGLYWLSSDYSFQQAIADFDSLPYALRCLLSYAMILPMLIITYFVALSLKRKGNPKSYPIDEDYEPSQAQNIGAMWGTAISGKKYRVSRSSKNYGEIDYPNQGK